MDIWVKQGDRVRIIDGTFENYVGTVTEVNGYGRVTVIIEIFGRPTPVDVMHTQLEIL